MGTPAGAPSCLLDLLFFLSTFSEQRITISRFPAIFFLGEEFESSNSMSVEHTTGLVSRNI
jgi:hypothetical protein